MQAQIKGCKEEHQNLLSALAWSQEANQALIGLRLGSALAPFWRTQGYFSEGRYWITQVLSHPAAAAATAERNETLIYAAQIATDQSDHALALAYGQEALVIAQTLGHDALRARAFSILASVARQQGDYEAAQHHGQAALELSRKLAQDELVAHALLVLSNNAGDMGKLGQARALAQESLTIYRKLGSRFQLGLNLNTLGFLGWMSGDLNEAKNYLEEALVIALDLPDLDLACLVQSNLGGVMLDLGEWTPAQSLAGQALEYRWAQKDKWGLAYSLENFASLVLQKEGRQAACLWGVAERLRQEIHAPMPPSWRIRYERFVGVAKSQVDQASFSAAWQEGTGMSLEEAVKYALETTVAQAALQKR